MGFFDVLLDAVDGAMTGKGNSFGAQLGKAFRAGYNSVSDLADDEEDQDWFGFCKYYAQRRAFYCVCFDVEHNRGYDDCRLITTFFDANENVIDQKDWIVPFDREIKQLNKTVHYAEEFLG